MKSNSARLQAASLGRPRRGPCPCQADARREMARTMTEDELLEAIQTAATLQGWRWHHVRRSDKAIQQGHSGFPDLVLARRGVVIFLELKREVGQATADQIAWLEAIDGLAGQRELQTDGLTMTAPLALLVRPVDLDAILGLLR
jgi:hypothetical protein